MKKTITLQVNTAKPQAEFIEQAAAVIRRGGLVAFPTETVYGLGADALNEAAVQNIFFAKGRPADNPLIVHVCSRPMLDRVASRVSAAAEALIARFWAGPLTLVLPRSEALAQTVSAGLATVAVRMPSHPIALALLAAADTPIAAPSANRSGRPSPTTAAHVLEDLDGRIEMVLDGGTTPIGIESTVIDMTADVPLILRPGWVTREAIEAVIGKVRQAASQEELKRSPGTRYRHYSPRARVILVEIPKAAAVRGEAATQLQHLCRELLETGKVALLSHTPVVIDDVNFTTLRLENSATDYARRIYAALRELDERRPDVIVVEGIRETHEGAAVMERLRRAASTTVTSNE